MTAIGIVASSPLMIGSEKSAMSPRIMNTIQRIFRTSAPLCLFADGEHSCAADAVVLQRL